MATSNGPVDGRKKSIITNGACQVCRGPATIINYGALSCLSCRTFFRRNAFPTKEVASCQYDGHCEVNTLTRKVCTGCRLAKCLTTIPQQSALDLPQGSNRLYLNSSDWSLISNVIHAFDTFSPVSEVRRTIDMFNTSPILFDRPPDASQSLHLMSSFYNSLQSFIRSIPDFQILTASEQCSLFQRNMLGLLCIGGMYLMRESGVFDKPENELIIIPFYGTEVIQQAKLSCQQLNCDPVVFKLMLAALAFSSNCYMLQNRTNIHKDSLLLGTFRLLGSQNVYVELMWNYLMYTYDYQYSVQRLSTLVRQLLYTLRLSSDMYENNPVHCTFINDTIERIETSSNVNDHVIVPLWGKK